MWSSFLGSPRPCHGQLLIPKQATPFFKVLVPSISATAQPQRRRLPKLLSNDDHQVGDLGHTILPALPSDPGGATSPIPKPRQEKQEQRKQVGEVTQISGSDVLWALQRATARKKKKQPQRRGSSSSEAIDYSGVRPICIKSEWGAKLDELEKRLGELSAII